MNLAALPQLAQDKANHHIYGEVAAAVGAVVLPPIARLLGYELDRRAAAAIAAAVIGVAKEVVDKVTGKGTPSFADFVATASGALPVIAGLTMAGAQ